MNTVFEHINSSGTWFVDFAAPMLLQSTVLVIILLLVDLLLRKKVRAVFRYCMWMLILVKLVLPSSLSSPVGIGNWLGYGLTTIPAAKSPVAVHHLVNENLPFLPNAQAAQKTSVVKPARPDIASQTQPAKIAATLTWQGGVFLFWLVVVAAMGLLLLQRAVFVCGLIRQAKEANNLMNDTLRFCCGQMGIKRNVGLKVSANATSPAVCGLFGPVILIPENLGSDFGVAGLRAVLFHELAHIKRFDLWVNLLQTILQIIYFYNPFVWLANWLIRRVREQAVDEMVLVTMGEKAQQYPETLINVARLAFKRPALSLRLIGVVESKSALAQRIKHILNRPIPKSAKLGILGLTVILIFAAVLLPMAQAKDSRRHLADSGQEEKGISEFKATLSNGVTVELVGVCDYPSKGKQWWKPDGSPLDTKIITNDKSRYTSAYPAYEIAFKVSGQDFNFKRGTIKGSGPSSNLDVIEPEGIIVCRVHIKPGITKTTATAGAAAGKWNTVATHNGQGITSKLFEGKKIILSAANESKQGLVMTITDDICFTEAARLIAVDKNNTTFTGNVQTGLSDGGMAQSTFFFANLSPNSVKEFQYQIRPYEYVTFKNVSLRPKETPSFIIKGTVTDAQTGKPIAGAKVGDTERYAQGKQWTITDTNGNYSYKTWYEEHGLRASANGYKPQQTGFQTRIFPLDIFAKEEEKIINFQLTPDTNKQLSTSSQQQDNVAQPPSAVNNSDSFTASLPNGVTVEDSRKLLMERRDILQQQLQTVEKEYSHVLIASTKTPQEAKIDLLQKKFQDAKIDLLRVESELAETPQERIDILEQIATLYLEEEKNTERLVDVMRTNQDELIKVKLLRLEAESDLAKAKTAANEKQANFKATLPNGVTVELVGVCEHPSKGKQWWRPDGGTLETVPFDSINVSISPMFGRSAYEMTVQISGAKDVGFRYGIEGTENSGSGDASKEGKQIENLYGILFDQSKNQASFSLHIGIAASAWETVAKQKADFQGVYSYKEIVWHGPVRQDGKTVLNVAHTLIEKNTRVIAIDTQGKQHIGGSTSGGKAGVESVQTTFNLPLEDVNEFQFQTRPYEWITFKNVSLKPNFKTDVQIRTGEQLSSGAGEKPAAQEKGSTDKYRKRYFVTIVADENDVRYEGQKVSIEQLEDMLKVVPNKRITCLELAYDPKILPKFNSELEPSEWLKNNKVWRQAARLVKELGFEYLSFTGADWPGSRRGPVSIRFEDELAVDKEIPVGLQSFEEKPRLFIRSAEFRKNNSEVNATLKMAITSWPKKRWEIGVRLLDEQGRQIDSVIKTFENSGIDADMVLKPEEKELEFSFGEVDLSYAKKFEVKIREFENISTKEANKPAPPAGN